MIDLSRPTDSGAVYEIALYRDDGQRLMILDRVESFVATRVANNVGEFSVILPADFDFSLLRPEQQVFISRKPSGGIKKRVWAGLIKQIDSSFGETGIRSLSISGPDFNSILASRVLVGELTPTVTGTVESILHTYIPRHLFTSGGTNYAFWPVAFEPAGGGQRTNLFTTDCPHHNGMPSITYGIIARSSILDWLTELCAYLKNHSTPTDLYFDFWPAEVNVFEFRTYLNQPGRNATIGQPGAIMFSADNGNLTSIAYQEDYRNEINMLYKLNSGSNFANLEPFSTATLGFATYGDSAGRYASSMYSIHNGFVMISADTNVDQDSKKALKEGRPLKKLTGNVKSVPGSIYGIDWEFGDRVNVKFDGRIFETIIKAVTFGVDNSGREILEAAVEITL